MNQQLCVAAIEPGCIMNVQDKIRMLAFTKKRFDVIVEAKNISLNKTPHWATDVIFVWHKNGMLHRLDKILGCFKNQKLLNADISKKRDGVCVIRINTPFKNVVNTLKKFFSVVVIKASPRVPLVFKHRSWRQWPPKLQAA